MALVEQADTGQPSTTAMMAAAARAAHLLVDQPPFIFCDPLASLLLGDRADDLINYHRAHGDHPVLVGARTQVTCRSRYAEAALARVVRAGVDQYVVLGAGLDSCAYRPIGSAGTRIFEVDHPAMQEWKRGRLSDAGITAPDELAYVPLDLESDRLAEALARAGFDATRPAMVSWLGVSMYLTSTAMATTLRVLGSFAPGTELIMDYMVPEHLRDEAAKTYVGLVAPVTAERGEPWLTFLTPDGVAELFAAHHFDILRQVTQREVAPEAWERRDALRPSNLARIAHARIAHARIAAPRNPVSPTGVYPDQAG